jgi:hypothetical protein
LSAGKARHFATPADKQGLPRVLYLPDFSVFSIYQKNKNEIDKTKLELTGSPV